MNATTAMPSRSGVSGFGIRAKLSLAIAAIVLTTFVASGIALYAFTGISSSMVRILSGALPVTVQSLRLSEQSTALAALAPALANARTQMIRGVASTELEDGLASLERTLEALRATGTDLAQVETESRDLASILRDLDRATETRLGLLSRRSALQRQIEQAHAQLPKDDPARLAQGNLLFGILSTALMLDDRRDLRDWQERFDALAKALGLEALIKLGEGDEGVFALRKADFTAGKQITDLLDASRTKAGTLKEVVDTLVAQASADGESAAHGVSLAIDRGHVLLLLTILASALVGIGIGWLYVYRQMGRRLQLLTETTSRLASGDLDCTIPALGRDELGLMGNALTIFRANAADAAAAHADAEREREKRQAERQEELHALAHAFRDMVQSVAADVTSGAGEVSGIARRLTDTASQATSRVNDALTATNDAETGVAAVNTASQELSQAIGMIAEQVDRSTGVAQRAVGEAERTSATVTGLRSAVDRIADVSRLIGDIAAQTNLLALNATIEAARAGEAGRGFAVVASEVKSLATQTAKATEDIALQIAAVDTATGQTAEALDGIGRTIGEIDGFTTAIAAAVRQQGSASDKIGQSVQLAAENTAIIARAVKGVSLTAKSTTSDAEDASVAADRMLARSMDLRRALDEFLERMEEA